MFFCFLFQTEKICALLAQLADASPESGFLSVHLVARFPHSDSIRLVRFIYSSHAMIQKAAKFSLFFFFFFFLLDFGLSRLTSLQFIQHHVAGFYKPTIPQSPPSHLQDYSICNNARLEFSTIFVPSFDPNEWCLKK
jgi:hypothetical protein